jgi:hypothetical protein
MNVFWMELSAEQKRWIQARVLVDTDDAASATTGISARTATNWKYKFKLFRQVYDYYCVNVGEANFIIWQNRIVSLGTISGEVIESYLKDEAPNKDKHDQAALGLKVIQTLMTPRGGGKAGRPPSDPEGQLKPKAIDVEDLTRRAQQRGLEPDPDDPEDEDEEEEEPNGK